MKLSLVLSSLLILLGLLATSTHADLLDCTEDKFVPLRDYGIGPKVIDDGSFSSDEQHQLSNFFKSVGCQIKKGATKVKDQAKKLGTELKTTAKKWGEKAKDLGSDIKAKFNDFKQRLSHGSGDDDEATRRFMANVEIINPDVQKAEEKCGHGFLLDALGNCSKLRK